MTEQFDPIEELPAEPNRRALRYLGESGHVVVNGKALREGDVVDGPDDVLAELARRSDFAVAEED